MKSTPITSLKAQMSRYSRMVKTGEEILITERDVPVAKLVPVGNHGLEVESRVISNGRGC